MSSSSIKKLRNEMITIEDESDKYIPCDKFYIVRINAVNTKDDIKKLTKRFLTRNQQHQPLVCYTFDNEICLVFSCVEENTEHYLQGSHQSIVSEYCSFVSTELNSTVNVKIIEFTSQSHIITYFTWKTYTNSRSYMIRISKGSINLTDTHNKTFGELIEILEKKGIHWDDIPDENKCGTFYKLKKKNGELVISVFSEIFDARNNKKYMAYIFGK